MSTAPLASAVPDERLRVYRRVFENSPDAIAILGPDGRYVEQNEAHRALMGYADAELAHKTPAAHLGEAQFARMADELARTGRFSGEVAIRAKDGRELLVELSAFTVRDAHGAVVCHVGIKRDVTAQRRAQEDLLRSERNLADFVETSAIGLHWVGADGTILWANRADHELLGYTREEFVGHPIAKFHADPEVIEDILARLRRGERLQSYPARLRAKDGSIRHVIIDSSVLWEDGEFVHTRCFTRDVTGERQAQEELEALRAQLAAAEKLSALGTLVSGVAHEIRTPLTYVANNLALASAALSKPDPEKRLAALDNVARALDGVDRINALVKDLRRFTQVRTETEVEAPLDAVVKEALDLFLATHRDADVAMELASVPPMRMCKLQVQQVVLNLLENAVDAAGPGGRVLVSTEPTPEGAALRVSDDGPGIAPHVRERIFEPFVTTKAHGTGLGLSIVRRVATEHGGQVACESEPGKGTTFVVRLPRRG